MPSAREPIGQDASVGSAAGRRLAVLGGWGDRRECGGAIDAIVLW